MLLGLLRVAVLDAMSVASIIGKARKNGRKVPYAAMAKATLKWMFPVRTVFQYFVPLSITSIAFHVAIIVTPLFLGTHILLWQRGLGVSWPAIPNAAADILTLVGIVTGLILFAARLFVGATRAISRVQDYVWPLVLVAIFLSGYLVMHPADNPFDTDTTLLVHVLSGDFLLLFIPFSKLSHAALFPATQIVSELGWFLEPESGRNVAVALGKENRPI